MKKNVDGSLTIYIQKDSPGQAKESNWLPAPNDTIYLVLRLYWPKETPPSILPAGEERGNHRLSCRCNNPNLSRNILVPSKRGTRQCEVLLHISEYA
jgi:hypothetical protein